MTRARRLAPLVLLLVLVLAGCASAPRQERSPHGRWLAAVDDATVLYNATRDAVAAAKKAELIPPDRLAKVDEAGRLAERSLRTFASAVEGWVLLGGAVGSEAEMELARAQAAQAIARLVSLWGGGT